MTRTEGVPHDRLTRIANDMLRILDRQGRHDVRAVILLDDLERGGMGTHNVNDQQAMRMLERHRLALADTWARDHNPAPLPVSISYVNYVLYGRPISDDSFAGRVMELFPKADPGNLRRLRVGFPWEYLAWLTWMDAPDGTGWEEDFRGKLADGIPPDPEVVV